MLRASCGLFVAVCIAFVSGCGGAHSATAHGTVMLNGQPLAGAEVQFIPKSDSSLGSHTTTTGPDGTFTLKAESSNAPVRPGSYVVVVNKWLAGDSSKGGGGMEGMKNEIPEAYRAQATTTLKAEIKEGESTLDPFHINTKTANRAGDPNLQMQLK